MKKKINNSRLVYFNGEFIPEKDAKVSIYDSALMFGDMVFEMTRSFNKNHFKLKEHIERLYVGLKILRINIKMTKDEMVLLWYETQMGNYKKCREKQQEFSDMMWKLYDKIKEKE